MRGVSPAAESRTSRNTGCYCEEELFFFGQAAEEDEQQQPLCVAVHFLVLVHCLAVVVHPVKPMVARQTTVRRVERDFMMAVR